MPITMSVGDEGGVDVVAAAAPPATDATVNWIKVHEITKRVSNADDAAVTDGISGVDERRDRLFCRCRGVVAALMLMVV